MNIAQASVNITINGVTNKIPLVTLLAWKHALALEALGMKHSKQNASTIIRRMFGLSRSTKLVFIKNMVDNMYKDVMDMIKQRGEAQRIAE